MTYIYLAAHATSLNSASSSSHLISEILIRGHCGRDRMVVGFATTCAINAYHH